MPIPLVAMSNEDRFLLAAEAVAQLAGGDLALLAGGEFDRIGIRVDGAVATFILPGLRLRLARHARQAVGFARCGLVETLRAVSAGHAPRFHIDAHTAARTLRAWGAHVA